MREGDTTLIYWAPLLHFYQPPTQIPSVLERICNESYRPLIRVFEEYPHAKVTVNINGSLTEMLRHHGQVDVIEGLRALARRGQLEFTGSGKYHPILPLISEDEQRRQIVLNRKTNGYLFGDAFEPVGFLPPEMAYSRAVVRPIIETGHRWILISGVACPTDWPMDVIHQVRVEEGEIAVFFRDDILSNKISFQSFSGEQFIQHLASLDGQGRDMYVITAMDAETFGHHIQDWETTFLAQVYEALQPGQPVLSGVRQAKDLADQHRGLLRMPQVTETGEIRIAKISELLDIFPIGDAIDPKNSSWSASAEDIAAGNPYPLWKDRDSLIHRLQWQHMGICVDLVKTACGVAKDDFSGHFASIARGLLDQALHSCQFWWASRRPMWDVNMIHKGLLEQQEVILNAYKAINSSGASDRVKTDCYYRVIAARDLASKIVDHLFMY